MDQQILFLINRDWTHPVLDRVMAAVSSFDLWWPFLVVLGLIVAWRGGFRMRAMLLVAGLAIGITDGIVVRTIKDVVGRSRPHEILEGVRTLDLAKAKPRFLALGVPVREEFSVARIQAPHGNSFPSAHTANNFAFAAVCVTFYRRWGWFAFLPALLVAYSRIYVGAHWPLDIVFSCVIGTGIGFLTAVTAEAFWRKWGGQFANKWHKAHPSLIST